MNELISDLRDTLPRTFTYYLNGGCLFFANKLKSLVGGKLRYLKDECHVVLEKDGRLYDIRGNVSNLYKNSSYLEEEEFFQRQKIISELTQETP